jgi:hypothetical protein
VLRAALSSVALAGAIAAAPACSTVTTVRLQPEAVEVGPNLRPLAGIQADAISAQVFFVSVPGVDLDRVVNQMLVVAAKTMGADKIANLQFEITPDGGFWAWRRFLGWRSARASGIAVQVTEPPPDPHADEGPEPPGTFPPEGLAPEPDPSTPQP